MIEKIIKKFSKNIKTPIFIEGSNKFLENKKNSKKALLSYLIRPIVANDPKRPFSNWGIARNLVKALNMSGYEVDIVNWDNKDFIPTKKYDLFIGHGGVNFSQISNTLGSKNKKIYFSTGLYWKEHNRLEKERFNDFEKRNKIRLSPDRLISYSEEDPLFSSSAIIALGDYYSKKSYSEFKNVFTLSNSFYPDKKFKFEKKNFEQAKNNFLFLAGSGNIHKGLDLLIEAFSKFPEKNLFICTKIETQIYNVYSDVLSEKNNIHMIDFVKERTTKMREIMNSCDYIIHPSCSEGSPGAVILGMSYGLIPVISKESNVDINDLGHYIENNSVDGIISTINNINSDNIKDKSKKVYHTALEKYSEKSFLDSLLKILNTFG